MKNRIFALSLLLLILASFFAGCSKAPAQSEDTLIIVSGDETLQSLPEPSQAPDPPSSKQEQEASLTPSAPQENEPQYSSQPAPSSSQEQESSAEPPEPEPADSEPELSVSEDGEYISPEEVALYIHTYHKLPSNFITKDEAKDLGWDNSRGNLQKVAPGKSIGGDRFGNYEGLLPKGKYFECDVNYTGGYRGGERLIYKTDGTVYYTRDHYESFEQLY